MRFSLTLQTEQKYLPFNYQYPLSAAIYKIIAKGDAAYAAFLHQEGYGKGFKYFTFSQLEVPFSIMDDRMYLNANEVIFQVAFHIPHAMESFVKGLFQSQTIEIADKKSKAQFFVKSIESLLDPLKSHQHNEIIQRAFTPLSPIVVGLPNEKGNYDFLDPMDSRFAESLIYNWRSKIKSCYDEETSVSAMLMIDLVPMKHPPKSRLMTIKADTNEMTRIRGWMNFGIQVTAEKRFIELLLNAGVGLYNAQGCGCVGVVNS